MKQFGKPPIDLSFRQPPNGNSPLHIASITGNVAIVKLLIEAGAEVNMGDDNGRTSLYVAALGGHIEVVKVLLLAGANVNKKSKEGLTPFYVACWRDHGDVARLLVSEGADIFITDPQGRTAWVIAREWNHVELATEIEAMANKASHGHANQQAAAVQGQGHSAAVVPESEIAIEMPAN